MNDIIKNKDKLDNNSEDENNKLLNQICINSIERNFGGIENSIGEFKSYFFEGYENDLNNINHDKNRYNVLKCIEDNINDENSRYLLVAFESSIETYLLTSIL